MKNRLIFLSLLIFCFPAYLLQEYFEPLFLIVFFTLFDLEKINLKHLSKTKQYLFFVFIFQFITLEAYFIDIV